MPLLSLFLFSMIQFAGADQGTVNMNEIKEKVFRSEVETAHYQFSEKLCYLYEFRKKNNLRLRNTDPFLEDNVIKRNWNDPKLQESLKARRSLMQKSLITLFDGSDPNTVTYLQNIYVQELVDSLGFNLAMEECSQRIQANAYDLVRKDLKLGDFILSNAPLFAAGGVAARGLFLGIRGAFGLIGVKSAAATYGVMGSIMGLAVYVSHEALKEKEELLNDMQNVIKGGQSKLIDPKILESWGYKQVLMSDLINTYLRLQQKHQQNIKIEENDPDLLQLNFYIKYIKDNRAIFEKKLNELYATSINWEDVLSKLIDKKSKSKLSESEQRQYEELSLLLLITTSFKIIGA